jgi:hypothetical protein
MNQKARKKDWNLSWKHSHSIPSFYKNVFQKRDSHFSQKKWLINPQISRSSFLCMFSIQGKFIRWNISLREMGHSEPFRGVKINLKFSAAKWLFICFFHLHLFFKVSSSLVSHNAAIKSLQSTEFSRRGSELGGKGKSFYNIKACKKMVQDPVLFLVAP